MEEAKGETTGEEEEINEVKSEHAEEQRDEECSANEGEEDVLSQLQKLKETRWNFDLPKSLRDLRSWTDAIEELKDCPGGSGPPPEAFDQAAEERKKKRGDEGTLRQDFEELEKLNYFMDDTSKGKDIADWLRRKIPSASSSSKKEKKSPVTKLQDLVIREDDKGPSSTSKKGSSSKREGEVGESSDVGVMPKMAMVKKKWKNFKKLFKKEKSGGPPVGRRRRFLVRRRFRLRRRKRTRKMFASVFGKLAKLAKNKPKEN
ncbi:hypothetical protein HPP92_019755 [Vanilla planifolia]|uniref:Uncharacterized protein n=1 Tax=Vanilla planifolia TaxID=51239 RepID=A0A835Q3G3_VANPL|nr:hypothetical protein HPP92_020203 [Vanilla planifolia]KAG0465591.1 hypothetical protein HPP92_019755 [Vanilla planifolia]